MVKQYINSISYREDEKTYQFRGDGCGDFEEWDTQTEESIVKDYIEYCKKQIMIAKKYLEDNTLND